MSRLPKGGRQGQTGDGLSRRRLLRLSVGGLAGASISGLLAACGGSEAASTAGAGNNAVTATNPGSESGASSATSSTIASRADIDPDAEATIVLGVQITDLDSSIEGGNLTLTPSLHLMEPLVMRTVDLKLEPFLGEKYEYADDTTLRFALRKNVTFHNGDPLTVDDVVYTLKRVSAPDSKSYHARFLKHITSIQATDDSTVEIKLDAPDAGLLGRLALIPIVPQKVVERLGDDEFNGNPVGTGPYKFVSWQRGDRVTMEVYPDYWREPAKIKRLVFRGITEDATRVAALQTGTADIIEHVPTDLIPQITNSNNVEIVSASTLRSIFVMLNTKVPPFDNVKMRQAVNYGIDKKLIVDGILDGYGTPLSEPFGKETLGFNPEYADYYDYDPDKAQALLKEADYNGQELNMIFPPGRYLKGDEVAANLVDQLAKVGVRVKLQALEFESYFENYIQKFSPDLHLAMWSNANDTTEANYNLELNIQSPPKGRGFYWSDPEVDKLIVQASQTLDTDAREKVYQQAVKIIVEAAPWIFLYSEGDAYGKSKRLQGWQPRPNEIIYTYGCYVTN